MVQLAPGVEPDAALTEEILAFAREHLAHYKCPARSTTRRSSRAFGFPVLPVLPTFPLLLPRLTEELRAEIQALVEQGLASRESVWGSAPRS